MNDQCDDCEHVGPDVVDYGHTILCDQCKEDIGNIPSDYDERMTERKQMGCSNF